MAFSYSGLTSYGKATLPSVEGWSTSHSVVRDPPKSIHLRRIDKVTDTNEVTLRVAEGTDRLNTHINYYARGVNHAVSVDFGNNGSNGGMMTGMENRRQTYAPYRIRDVFRPPIVPLAERLPLSRQPRNFTTVPSTVYDPRYDSGLSRWGGCTEDNVHAYSRDVKKKVMLKQYQAAKSVTHAFSTQPFKEYNTSPFISDSLTRNTVSNMPTSNYAKAFQRHVVEPEAAANAAMSRMDNTHVLRGAMNTNPSGRPSSDVFAQTDYQRLAPRLPLSAPSYPHYNATKPIVHV